jgi:hypothetical protein
VIAAMVNKLKSGAMLLNLPALLNAVGDSVATDIPVELMPHVARALLDADLSEIERLVIQPPLVQPGILTDGTFILTPDIDAIRAAVHRLVAVEAGHTPPPD